MRRLLRATAVLVCVGVTMGQPAVAWAHTGLDTASPAPGQEVAPGVDVVSLTFTEPLAGDSHRVTVTRGDGSEVPSGEPVLVDDRSLCVAVEALTTGIHTVDYAATSYDGHPTSGRFLFEVTPNGQALGRPEPCRGVTLPAAAGPAWPAVTVALAGLAVVLGTALVGWFLARRRRAAGED